MTQRIAEESPLTEDLELLFARHTADMHADTPPESIHMMDRGALAREGVRLFVLREAGKPSAMGALKRINAEHAELKSMHVLAESRGRGLSRQILEHLVNAAKAEGYTRLSLETGIQPTFIAARALYERAGFSTCGPFEGYGPDPNSVFMTRALV
ncbi:GNAT family N-acetyltransferase [Xinfangfangia sp. CPCC 101601]|uniref:GNAT family N-acetyltransferase n=1 Tax=Pseudogemmobacter lacusdianii TaxID=3069608 RepID=A0ABU0VSY3_9RHOB|nr:GNAT family N-acetyltransferase [Xinfangfangia sp. CPCC 101601]MDQ2064826.1 GNAT family N-acetyltransferase [Xinfangfangia sp. CPCC 101601]